MTMTKEKKMTITCNIICAVMVVVFLAAFIFLPFWSYTSVETSAITGETVTEDRTVSLANYVWFAREHKDLFGKWNKGQLKDFDGNKFDQTELTEMPFMATLLGLAGLVFCLWKRDKAWTVLLPAAAGTYMMIGLLSSSVMKTGQCWLYLVIATGALLVATLPGLIRWLVVVYKWFTVKKRHY